MNGLQKLVAVINDMAAPTHVVPAAPAPLLDPFMDNQLFDISSGAGAATLATAPSPLDVTWDGTSGQFP